MIISNPLNLPVVVTLNFNAVANPIVRNAIGVDVLFTLQPPLLNFVTQSNYKTNRNSGVNWQTGNGGNVSIMGITPTKHITLAFGPMDVHILKFISSPPFANNGWQKEWTNNGSGNINGWNIKNIDQFVAGDFDGDTKEEVFAIQKLNNNAWATILNYENNDFQWGWSNYGNGTINGWSIKVNDKFFAGDFDGDGKDELLCIQSFNNNAWATMLNFENGNWQWGWSNYGNGTIDGWGIKASDKFIIRDFNNDGKDELLCVQSFNTNAWATMLNFENGNWQWGWSNYGNGTIDGWGIKMQDEYYTGDYNGDGKSDLFFVQRGPGSWATMLYYNTTNNNWDWIWSNYGSNSIAGWQAPPQPKDRILVGDIDNDGKDEIMFIQRCNNTSCGWATSIDYNTTTNQFTWNWSNYSAPPYIYDWYIPGDVPFLANYFFIKPIKATTDTRDYLFAYKRYGCSKYLASMYKTDGSQTNYKIDYTEDDFLTTPYDSSTISGAEINIYPNPNNGTFTIDYYGEVGYIKKIEVYNIFGQLVKQIHVDVNTEQKISNHINITAVELPHGLYIIKCSISDGTQIITRINFVK